MEIYADKFAKIMSYSTGSFKATELFRNYENVWENKTKSAMSSMKTQLHINPEQMLYESRTRNDILRDINTNLDEELSPNFLL
ncbi:hypothetical protein DPMN_007835 [Dreissena polymorpha]|uniref:Uncharacterized protein n=1 Tax=Dreissena polymorpha TaxID=45954 RepID=A0A9D4MU03_DREPO|nr:hypothetical protein DPMN_007835 [Dreissena polymorpha]